jgi:SNF2 family DNA or RNA helicase
MNFLDPSEWDDLERLEDEYEELDEDLIKQLHERLRPYFLRRAKSQVLKLPPKVPYTYVQSFRTHAHWILERGHRAYIYD